MAHEEKDVTIYVNTKAEQWPKNNTISYEQVVDLAFPNHSPQTVYSVKYSRGHGNKPEGNLVKGGEPVKVKEEMSFIVWETSES